MNSLHTDIDSLNKCGSAKYACNASYQAQHWKHIRIQQPVLLLPQQQSSAAAAGSSSAAVKHS
jgi:hypothetical protein